jgi:calcium-dependent protein kinase
VLKGNVDFKSEPWPRISDAAKDCVRKLLEMDASKRITTEQVCAVRVSVCACTAVASRRVGTVLQLLVSSFSSHAAASLVLLPLCWPD